MLAAWCKLKKALSFKSQNGPSHSIAPAIFPSSSSSSSSSLSGFPGGFSTTPRSTQRTCVICLGSMKFGSGQAIFTAECRHTFHFSCIRDNVKHGNHLCPICRCKWKEIPSVNGINVGDQYHHVSPYHAPLQHPVNITLPIPIISPPHLHPHRVQFSDDEPLSDINMDHTTSPSTGYIHMKSYTECPEVAAAQSVEKFGVLVKVKAPSLVGGSRNIERAPIDLVTVLDVSRSMNGAKLILLKQAMCYVIENLGPSDRLSVVTFSSSAQRNFPLRRMTEQGRQEAILAINGISTSVGTNIVEGLKMGARVLEERNEKNPVASIILLSDGRDTYNRDNMNQLRHRNRNLRSSNSVFVPQYLNLLPPSIRPSNRQVEEPEDVSTYPVHTFGLGSNHDSSAMYAISDASSGTFSFIESSFRIQEAFAMCIGGLLSVVAQELQLKCTVASFGVKMVSIPTSRYVSEVSGDGQLAVINIGDLYADEEREFLVYLSIPSVEITQAEERVETYSLLQMVSSYKHNVSNKIIIVEGDTVKIHRPQVLSPIDVTISLEVDRHINWLAVIETIKEAQEMADMGDLEGGQALLTNRRSTLSSSAFAQAGDGLCNRLEAELTEITERMSSEERYNQMGRPYLLSGLSSHVSQRATTRGNTSSNTGAIAYETPSMTRTVSNLRSLTFDTPR